MKLTDKTPSDGSDLKYVKFDAIGDYVTGLYLRSEQTQGKFGPRLEVTLKTRDGEKIVTCSKHLERVITSNLEDIKGKVLTITYTSEKDIGKGNPMKVFDVDVRDNRPGAKPVATPIEADEDPLPF
jgi:hypothetical protein